MGEQNIEQTAGVIWSAVGQQMRIGDSDDTSSINLLSSTSVDVNTYTVTVQASDTVTVRVMVECRKFPIFRGTDAFLLLSNRLVFFLIRYLT